MTTIIDGIKIEDDWVQEEASYTKNYIMESTGLNPIFEIWKSDSSKWFLISIYHYKISIAIDDFYNHSFLDQQFSSVDEAKLYVDNFINKYNKLKAFI